MTFRSQELHPSFSKILVILTDQYEFLLIKCRIDLKSGGVKQLVSDIMTVSTVVGHFWFLDFAVSTFRVLIAIRGGVL